MLISFKNITNSSTNMLQINLNKIRNVILILGILMSCLQASAQHDHLESDDCSHAFIMDKTSYTIEYGSSVNFRVANFHQASLSWQLEGKKSLSGTGAETGEIQFDQPGNYKITFSCPATAKFAAYSDTATITVLPAVMKFLIDQASFNKTLASGQSASGIEITVPVQVSSYTGEAITYGPFRNTITGIDGLEVILDKQVTLKPGIHNLTFSLKGTPGSAGKGQIGFFNNSGEGFFYNFLISK